MNTSTRKKLGWLLVLLALGAIAMLALSDVQLLRVSSRPLPATGVQTPFILAHWSVAVVFLMFVGGAGLLIFPRPSKAA